MAYSIRKIICGTVLIAALVFALTSVSTDIDAEAYSGEFEHDGYTYGYYDYGHGPENLTVLKYSGDRTALVLPEKVVLGEKEYRVTVVGERAFEGNRSIIDVTLPKGYVEIGAEAFKGSGIFSITLPDTVKNIGERAFTGSNLTNVIVPSSVLNVGNESFKDCRLLKHVSIASAVIGTGAFSGCTDLADVEIGRGTETIGGNAFNGCTSLAQIALPEKITSLGNGTFEGCSALTQIVVPENVVYIGAKAFDGCTQLTRIDILNGSFSDEMVGENAFNTQSSKLVVNCGSPSYKGEKGFGFTEHAFNESVFTATFTGEGVSHPPTEYHAGETIFVPPEKEGYEFRWYSVSEKDVYYSIMPAKDVELMAKYIPKTYTITFRAGGEIGDDYTQEYICDRGDTLRPNLFDSETKKFVCWVIEGSTKTLDDCVSTDGLCGDLILVARWEESDYTVVFDSNDGSGKMLDQAFDFDEKKTLRLNEFTMNNYDFAGWSDTKNGPVRYVDGQEVENIASAKGSVKLYAVWSYTITYHKNAGGSDSTNPPQIAYYNQNTVMDANPYAYKFHSFVGWALDKKGSKVFDDRSVVKNLASEYGKSVHLYAVWDVSAYEIRFDPGDGDGKMDSIRVKYYEDFVIPECGYTYKNHNFKHWVIIYGNGSEKICKPGEVVRNLYEGDNFVVLNAVWEKNPGTPVWVYYATGCLVLLLIGFAFVYSRSKI